ncbi:MAG: tRNA-dihydrouridine synthase C [Chlamydiales bacterium]|jgi:tRNA-dihydrouridine synthase C
MGPVQHDLPFTSPWLLAPMEGVTDPVFRGLILGRHAHTDLGGAFTEFVRVVDSPLHPRVLRRHLGLERFSTPVGLQLMGSDLEALAGSARRVADLDVPLLDLNFGCPAKGALRGCAGSALLRDPAGLEAVVRTCVDAVEGRIPVSAKIRAGYDDALLVEDLARSAESGGAAMLTVHCRTRAEAYQPEVDWSRIARAVESVSIPTCGNGGIRCHADLERMRSETGCAFVMVGHGALADPWIFSDMRPTPEQALGFLCEYVERMRAVGRKAHSAMARLKQLVRVWSAGDLIPDEAARLACLREKTLEELQARLSDLAQTRRATSASSATP